MVYSPPSSGAYPLLRDLIVRGRLAPGTSMVEAEVAQRLGISRTPVREALQRLRHDGLVVPAGGGARPRLVVAPMSREMVDELYLAMGALEGAAARTVARLAPADRTALANRLAERHDQFCRAAAANATDWDELFERHDAFHRALQEACAGPRIQALLDALRPQVDRYEWLFAPLTGPDYSATGAEHDAIIAAVREGVSADDVERAVRANWLNGGERLARAIELDRGAALARTGWEGVTLPTHAHRKRRAVS
jgi:DNA-binding GntR family transcriptional regulator